MNDVQRLWWYDPLYEATEKLNELYQQRETHYQMHDETRYIETMIVYTRGVEPQKKEIYLTIVRRKGSMSIIIAELIPVLGRHINT